MSDSKSEQEQEQQEDKKGERAISYYHDSDKVEWRNRPISIVGAAKSFVSQLSWGTDLTKVSLPCLFCAPFSGTEVTSSKCLEFISALDMNKGFFLEDSPAGRMKGIVAWYLSIVQPEPNNALKPFNPILGELHWAWTESDSMGQTRFFLEQVSHHPPLAAWRIENAKQQLCINGNVGFAAAFYMNSAAIKGTGFTEIHLEKYGEVYSLSTPMPDMTLKNILLPGPRRLAWESKIRITCAKTGFTADIEFKEDSKDYSNVVTTTITGDGKKWLIQGIVGGKIQIQQVGKIEVVKKESSWLGSVFGSNSCENIVDQSKFSLFLDAKSAKDNAAKVFYPKIEDLTPNNSLCIWRGVSDAIRKGDLEKGDALKLEIEQTERKKRQTNNQTKVQYFQQEKDGNWYIKNSNTVKEFSLYK